MDSFLLANLILWYDLRILGHRIKIAVYNIRLRYLRRRLDRL
jgi:hypothetical protein